MDIPTIAAEIAASIMASCAPGALPSQRLMLTKFVDAYGLVVPSESDHRRICDLVGALINKRR